MAVKSRHGSRGAFDSGHLPVALRYASSWSLSGLCEVAVGRSSASGIAFDRSVAPSLLLMNEPDDSGTSAFTLIMSTTSSVGEGSGAQMCGRVGS